jgi:SAM-dependent methyltransferase
MHTATSLTCTKDESDALDTLLSPDINKNRFQSAVRRLHTLFKVYACTCPVPLPAPGLIVTPEIRTQCERYLPIAEVAAAFNHLYSTAVTYPPIFSSTPFHSAFSWADTFAALPAQFQFSANPARLLESLLVDGRLLTRFLFASFLPGRFYGGIGRYPGQQKFVSEWLKTRKSGTLHCLDAACGTGEDTFGLALLLSEEGFSPEEIRIDGWTLEPLEVWAAAHRRFPHDRRREALLRGATSALFQQGYGRRISFRCRDILKSPTQSPLSRENGDRQAGGNRPFDLILCNGLLGGPIVHEKEQLNRAVGNLAQLLAPGGILLAADNFHGGWKQKCPQTELRASFETHRLEYIETGEGIGGLNPD